MKFGLAMLCSLCFLALGSAQENSPSHLHRLPLDWKLARTHRLFI